MPTPPAAVGMSEHPITGSRATAQGADRETISVVVPVRNGMPWIRHQLQALADQRFDRPFEVVVADNGSTDGTKEFVESWSTEHENVRLVDASGTVGPSSARNAGAREAGGDLLAFCDADDVVDAGWLAACAAALNSADVVAGSLDTSSLNRQQEGRGVPAYGVNPFDFLPHGSGSNMAVRRRAFEAVEGFDSNVITFEDADLFWRLQLKGYRMSWAEDAVVSRRNRSGLAATFEQRFGYGRSGPLLYRRYRAAGMPRGLRRAGKGWVWLVVTAPLLVNPQRRAWWVQSAGLRIGRLVGSFEQRVLFL
jgi:glycosyltransferase involved in cell wall biosynthesis